MSIYTLLYIIGGLLIMIGGLIILINFIVSKRKGDAEISESVFSTNKFRISIILITLGLIVTFVNYAIL